MATMVSSGIVAQLLAAARKLRRNALPSRFEGNTVTTVTFASPCVFAKFSSSQEFNLNEAQRGLRTRKCIVSAIGFASCSQLKSFTV
jgi:hypothetical protein